MKQKLLSLLFVMTCAISVTFSQTPTRSVTGRVTSSDDGTPIASATVSVQGTSQAVQTGNDGSYSIAVTTGATLVFRAVGFEDRRVTVGTSSTINVSMVVSAEDIDEVVVVGYGTVRRADFTGSAVTVTAADIDKRPITNVMEALQGAGPGIQTTTPTGSSGSEPTIRIRGIGSYSASNDPLIIVDGVEYTGGMSNINPADVESITTLKDAATMAIYGSRGANGVVMITTKRGQAGRSEINFSVQHGANANSLPQYDVVSPGEYYELMWEAYKNNLIYHTDNLLPADIAAQIASGQLPRNAAGLQTYNGGTYQDLVQLLGNYNAFNVPNDQLVSTSGVLNPNASLLYGDDLNWEEQASRIGRRSEYGVNYSAGFGKSDVYASVNYLDDQTWALNSYMKTIRARLNANTQLTDWLRTGINMNANYDRDNNRTFGTGIVNPFAFARGMGPIYPVHVHDPVTGEYVLDDLGNRVYDIGDLSAEFGLVRPYNSGRHAIAENLWNLDYGTRDFVGGRGYVDINILPWLTFNSTISFDLRNQRGEAYQNTIVGDGAPAGRYSQNWSRRLQWTFFQYLQANKSWDGHNLSATLGHEAIEYKNETISGLRQGEGFQNFYTFTNFTDINSLNSGLLEESMESYFARANYDYQNRYYLSTSLRTDGDSKIPPHNRWAAFWSVSGKWRLENEPFFNVDWVNALQLRASYGVMGNNRFGTATSDYYPFQPGYGIGVNNVSYPGAILSALGSPDLRWESQKPFDVGVEFSLFRGRLSGIFEYYNRVSGDLLFNVPQPFHNGGLSNSTPGSFNIRQNVGDMRNHGIELSLTGGLVRKPEFSWDLTFNITTLKNKILKMPATTPSITSSPYRREVGYSIYEFYTRTFYGVDPDDGRVMYLGVTEYDPENENIRIIGVDTVTYDQSAARQDWLGKQALADAYGSIINRFTYKNFDLNFVVLYSLGGYTVDGPYNGFMNPGPNNGSNLHRDLLNGWRNPGDVTDIPRMQLNQSAVYNAPSDRFLTSASYIGVNTLSLAYRVPEAISARAHLKRARVFVSGENLYFWTARKGLNTMTNIVGASANTSFSPARTLNVGVNFGF